jgi:beta-galactosidase
MRCPAFVLGLIFALLVVPSASSDDAAKADRKFTCIDLKDKSNQKLKDQFHAKAPAGNNLDCLTAGEQTLEGIRFKIGEGYIRLASSMLNDKADKVEGIKVDKRFNKLHILHATGWDTNDETIIGEYTITWEDDTTVTIPIVYGKDVLNWWTTQDPANSRVKVAWSGENEASKRAGRKIYLYLTTWENPKPEKKVKTIDFSSTKETMCAPFCVGMTVEE